MGGVGLAVNPAVPGDKVVMPVSPLPVKMSTRVITAFGTIEPRRSLFTNAQIVLPWIAQGANAASAN